MIGRVHSANLIRTILPIVMSLHTLVNIKAETASSAYDISVHFSWDIQTPLSSYHFLKTNYKWNSLKNWLNEIPLINSGSIFKPRYQNTLKMKINYESQKHFLFLVSFFNYENVTLFSKCPKLLAFYECRTFLHTKLLSTLN